VYFVLFEFYSESFGTKKASTTIEIPYEFDGDDVMQEAIEKGTHILRYDLKDFQSFVVTGLNKL
jgi:hypothetical protein